LGHLTLDPYGAICSCGNRGCLETVFSARAIEADARAAVHRGCDSVLTRLFREQPQLATCRTVFQAASEGDAGAITVFDAFAWWVALGLVNLVNLLDPALVVVGGGLIEAGGLISGPLREEVWSRSRGLLGRDVPIVGSRSPTNRESSAPQAAVAPRPSS
jgi:glucokinase